jgi:Tol biopolymer transport system component
MSRIVIILYSVYFILALLFTGCSDPESADPFTNAVIITTPQMGAVLAEDVTIDVRTFGAGALKMAELWVNQQAVSPIDYIQPYSFIWPTTNHSDSAYHRLFVRVYYSDNRRVDSEEITVFVDNSNSIPSPVNLIAVTHLGSTFVLSWTMNNNDDFQSYIVYESFNQDMTNARPISTILARGNTSHTVFNIAEEETRYYQIVIRDNFGLENASNIVRGSSLSKILFVSDRQGNDEIYVMSSDGNDVTNLTNREADDYFPVFSPDQSWVSFIATRTGNPEVFIMNSDGKKQENLSNNFADDLEPVFSVDSRMVAFTSYRNNNAEIYAVDISGQNLMRLTSHPAADTYPRYSRDGQYILFVSERTGNADIFRMDHDGNNQINLTNHPANDASPLLSADGSHLFFVSDRDGSPEIYRLNLEAGEPERVTFNSGQEKNLTLSPDGSTILYQSGDNFNDQIYLMARDGSNQINLSGAHQGDLEPTFSVYGSRIFFQNANGGNNEIYCINADGTDRRNISNNSANDRISRSMTLD